MNKCKILRDLMVTLDRITVSGVVKVNANILLLN